MVDFGSAIWHYGFGRMEGEREAKKKAKAYRGEYEEPEPLMVELAELKVEGLRLTLTVKNVDEKPASVMKVNCWKILKHPRIERRFLRKKVRVREKIDREVQPEMFTIFPGETLTFTMWLAEPFKAGWDYAVELCMGEYWEPLEIDEDLVAIHRLGWMYLLNFDGREVRKVAKMSLSQAEAFWLRLKMKAGSS